MSRTSQVEIFYREILDGKTVKVTCLSKEEFETIRTTLHRYHRLMREIGGSELSIQASFNGQDAFFRLGDDRRTRKNYVFEVLDDPNAQVSEPMEQDSSKRDSDDNLSSEGRENNQSCDL